MKSPISIKRYLSLHFGIVAILPVVTIAGLVWFFMMPTMQVRTGLQHQALAHAIAGQVATYLKDGEHQLNALAEYLRDRRALPGKDPVRLLDAHCGSGEFFETLFVVDHTGKTIQAVGLPPSRRSNRADFVGLDLSGRQVAGTANGTAGAAWSKTFLSTVSSRMAVSLTVPLADGFIIGEVTLDRLSAFIRQLPVESGFLTLVIDGQGQIVADSGNLHWGEMLRGDVSAVGQSEATRAFEWDGEPMLGTLVAMDTAGWKVLVAQSVRRAFQPLRDAFALIAFGLVVALGLALTISWLLSGKFAMLFTSYADRAEAIAEGRYDLQWPAANTRESYRLGQGLERMAQKISRREKALMESEGRLKKLTANVPGVVYRFRATREHAYGFDFLSEKATEIFGLEADLKSFNLAFYECIPDDEKKRFIGSVRTSVDRCEPWNYEGRFTKPDGTEIWFSSHANPRDEGEFIVYYGVLMDITRRRQMEETLRFTQFTFDKAAVGIHYIGSDGRIINVNEHAARLLGYTVEELKELSLFDIDPLMNAESFDFLWGKMVVESVDILERVHVRKDGSRIPVGVVSNFLEYDGRQFSICFIQDISERKRMEQALKESEERLDLALSGANEGIWDWHVDDGSVYFDSRYYIMAGYEPGEFPGVFDEWEKRVHKDDIEKAKTAISRYLAGDLEAFDVEFRFRRKDGGFMWIQSRGKVVARNDQGTPQRFIGTHADITRRKKAEETLRHLRNYLSNIIDSMPSVLVAVDSDGNVIQWNHRTEQTTGLSFEAVRSQPLARVFPRLADEMDRIQTAIRECRVISAPKVTSKHEHETRYEDITIFPLAANGVEGAVIRVDDVTERVRLEEMMIQSEKMLSVGGLAAGMAHEINNPLAGMMQTAEVMAGRLGANLHLPASRKAAEAAGTTIEAVGRFMEARGIPRMLATINDSGRRVAAIVDNMLSFARKSEATVSSHALEDLLDRTLELAATDYDLKKQYDFKKIAADREYAASPVIVPCEGAKIQQVVLNILRNGAEAMQEAGTEAPRFVFRTRVDPDADMAVMEIEDNGPGMDEQTRKRVFEPFFTTKPAGVGTGLGMSVSYFIITENHHGEMAVVSRPGAGSRFIIRLPLEKMSK